MNEITRRLNCDICKKKVKATNKLGDARFYCMECGRNLGISKLISSISPQETDSEDSVTKKQLGQSPETSQPLVNTELSKASRGVPPIGQVSSKTPNTPQTKPSIDNKISTSDVKNMTGDKTAETIILQIKEIKLNLAILADYGDTSIDEAQYNFKLGKLNGMKEMLEAVENIIPNWCDGCRFACQATECECICHSGWIDGRKLRKKLVEIKEKLQ